MSDVTFEDAQRQLERVAKRAAYYNKSVASLTALRDELCPHTNVTYHEKYYPGGYLDKDYTDYWGVCDCCHKRSDVTRKSHGNFG